jgi:hypothetical protein
MSEPTIKPVNLSAQFSYRAAGNPDSTLPGSAISNSFPGLECDFRNVWRRIFAGIVLHESDNYVVEIEDEAYNNLKGRRLLFIEEVSTVVKIHGPNRPNSDVDLGFTVLEWSNVLAAKLTTPGREMVCYFSQDNAGTPIVLDAVLSADDKLKQLRDSAIKQTLRLRPLFAQVTQDALTVRLPVIDRSLVQPGELTQSLCSPWQNDYRECACYYWAASRPDFVNKDLGPDGRSRGQNWMMKDREKQLKEYIPDDFTDSRLITYDELFLNWQKILRFQVEGKDYE